MSTTIKEGTVTVALVGNPNTGKSTLFNALAGVHQRVGNYPGVTVEKKIGRVEIGGRPFALIDLPGTYSLAPRSPDEMITVDVLLGRRDDVASPDVVLCIVDASNLERNLYLVSQVLDIGLPVVVALNMTDVARDKGLSVNVERLRQQLGIPVVQMQANRKLGLGELKDELATVGNLPTSRPDSPFPPEFQQEVAHLGATLNGPSDGRWPRFLVERLLLDSGGYLEQRDALRTGKNVLEQVQDARQRLSNSGIPVPAVEALARYQWVDRVLAGVVARPRQTKTTLTDKIDKVLTDKVWGSLIFVALMILVFQAIFSWATPLMDAVQSLIGGLGQWIASVLPEGMLQSLLTDGVIAGVGGVLVFLPQIFILFFFIALLEDCGYMARAAYLMDKLMCRVGLSGKSFIPLLSSFACAIPGIMAARVIENRRDRLVTILVAPLMSCSARLPVYTLLIAAFIPNTTYLGGWLGLQGVTMFAMYMIGIVVAVLVALVLKMTILQGETPLFVMELPSYKVPSAGIVLWRVWDRGWAFIRRAGTLILAVTILVWAAAYFPHDAQLESTIRNRYVDQVAHLKTQIAELTKAESAMGSSTSDTDGSSRAELEEELDRLDSRIANEVAGAYMEQSLLGRAGHIIEPLVRPLGWDWRIGCAVIASFPAREVVIGTLGVIYHLGQEQDEESKPLRDALVSARWAGTDRPVFNVPVALSIMVFFALCAQCASTLVIMRRETASWRWPVFTFAYMTTLAYLGALVTYRMGMFILS